MPTQPFCPFPKDFIWGCATAAYQIEGAHAEDGRTPSVWDTFSHRPGNVAMDHTGDTACDHYHRYKQDVQLMKSLGLQAYRFSSSWSRVIPERGVVNPKGVDFYKRLVDELLSNNIRPWLTLFHWDLPQWCEDKYGGWESKQCADDFADYATVMAKAVGDRVAGFMTINEFMCFLDKAYIQNNEPFAPGKVVCRSCFTQSRHHAIYGHGLVTRAIKAVVPKAKVGLADNMPALVPLSESPEDIAAAKKALRELSGMYLTPILEGKYHESYLAKEGPDAPKFTDEEMKTISTPLDFVAANLYAPQYVRASKNPTDGSAAWEILRCDDAYPKMNLPWLNFGPSILYWTPRLLHETYGVKEIYISENGCHHPDRPTTTGEVQDLARVMFLQNYLVHAHRATAENIPLKGYFLWSLMDNFEWAQGYTKRFGIHYVNYETQQRTPKLSAKFYADVIRRNAVGG